MRLKVMAISTIGLLAGLAAGIALLPGALESLLPDKQSWTIGKAAIGGPFQLVDHNGRTVTEKTYNGQYLLVFFGFTYCPDVCPAALQTVTAVMKKLGRKADRLRPLFISVDPERDRPAVLKQYVSNFDSRIVGLTGSAEQVSAAAKAYRVYFRKVKDAGNAGSYTMDHSAFVYLMSPQGEFVTHFTHATPVEKMAERLSAAIR